MKIANNIPVREVEEDYINIQPIQAAGRLTVEAMKALIAYGDGYSACDQCRKPFRLDKITKPNIAEFHTDLAELLHMDEARVTPCLLYTSDAADDLTRVDLGGRR